MKPEQHFNISVDDSRNPWPAVLDLEMDLADILCLFVVRCNDLFDIALS